MDGNYADPSESGAYQQTGQTNSHPRPNSDYVDPSEGATEYKQPTAENKSDMSHYHKIGEDPPNRPPDTTDENYTSPSHYHDTGQQTERPCPNSDYEDTSAGQTR